MVVPCSCWTTATSTSRSVRACVRRSTSSMIGPAPKCNAGTTDARNSPTQACLPLRRCDPPCLSRAVWQRLCAALASTGSWAPRTRPTPIPSSVQQPRSHRSEAPRSGASPPACPACLRNFIAQKCPMTTRQVSEHGHGHDYASPVNRRRGAADNDEATDSAHGRCDRWSRNDEWGVVGLHLLAQHSAARVLCICADGRPRRGAMRATGCCRLCVAPARRPAPPSRQLWCVVRFERAPQAAGRAARANSRTDGSGTPLDWKVPNAANSPREAQSEPPSPSVV